MGLSKSKAIARDTTYTDSSWYTGPTRGTVRVGSCRVVLAAGLGVHHCIIVECPSMDKWVVYEWSSSGSEFYACSSIGGQFCMTLGEFTLDQVHEAAKAASYGATYGTRYNCNHWLDNLDITLQFTGIVSVLIVSYIESSCTEDA